VPESVRASCYLGLGDHERVLEWLEKGYEQRDSGLSQLPVRRAFKPLYPDPRFQHLLRRLGLLP